MRLSIIVAMDRNRVIGNDNALPWYLPSDLKFFKRITMGKPIIMGRKTFQSIGRPLPGRRNIVITHSTEFSAGGALIAHSLPQALNAAEPAEEAMLIGGASLYRQALVQSDRLYLTEIDAAVAGDTYFPPLQLDRWLELWCEEQPADSKHQYAHRRRLLIRVQPGNE